MEKIIDIEERIPSMREKRRRKTNKKFLFIMIVFLVALLAILYFQSPLSKVKEINISGAKFQDSAVYLEQSGLVIGSPIWAFSIEAVEKKISEMKGIQNVKVNRKWLQGVDIAVTEWETVAYIENQGTYTLLLENGETFPVDISLPEAEAPILNKFSKEEDFEKITSQLLKMDDNVYHLISEIIFMGTDEDPEPITVFMDDGYEVRAVISTFAENMKYYTDVIAQLNGIEKGVIDIEVGTYFTPFSKQYGEVVEEEGDLSDEKDE